MAGLARVMYDQMATTKLAADVAYAVQECTDMGWSIFVT